MSKRKNKISITVDVGYIDIDVDMSDFDDSDLIEELESRNYVVIKKDKETEYLLSIFTKDDLKSILELIDKSKNTSHQVEFIRNKIVWSI
jgi:hypothetical protein